MFAARLTADAASAESKGTRKTKEGHLPTPSAPRIFRSISAWVYGGCVWAFCTLCAVLAVLQEPFAVAVRILVVLATVSLLTWVFLVRPHLSVMREAVVVSNVLRTHVIPFGSVLYVRTRGLVEVIASQDGEEHTFKSWNAPGNRAWKPSRAQVHAAGYPGAPRSPQLSRTGSLAPGGGTAQRLIEEAMDQLSVPDTTAQVSTSWNVNSLLPALGCVLISFGAWWL